MKTQYIPLNSELNQNIDKQALKAMAEEVTRKINRALAFLPGPCISSAWLNIEEASQILDDIRQELLPISWRGQTLKDKGGV